VLRTRALRKIAETPATGKENPSLAPPDADLHTGWMLQRPQAWQYLIGLPVRRIVRGTSAATAVARLQGTQMNGPASADRTADSQAPRTERLTVAELRRATPLRLWGGKGCGVACDFCRVLVSSNEIEYEVEAQLDGARVTLHFHPRCHDAWKIELATGEAQESEQPRIQTPA